MVFFSFPVAKFLQFINVMGGFLCWVLACSQKCEGILNIFTPNLAKLYHGRSPVQLPHKYKKKSPCTTYKRPHSRRCTIVGHPGWSVVWDGRYVLREGGGLLFPKCCTNFATTLQYLTNAIYTPSWAAINKVNTTLGQRAILSETSNRTE
jgi:hypothetical protein